MTLHCLQNGVKDDDASFKQTCGFSQQCINVLKGNSCECDEYWKAEEGACTTCKVLTKLRCNGCNLKPFFCSKECQTKAWEAGHKAVCGFWKEIHIDGKSFHEAKKRIPAGTKLFRRQPIYTQPYKMASWQYYSTPFPLDYIQRNVKMDPLLTCLSCLGFCAPIEPVKPTNIKYRRCPVCQWPVCNAAKCARKHKDMPECLLLAKNKVTFEDVCKEMEPYGLIGMIRAVCLKKDQPNKWDQLMKLETFRKDFLALPSDEDQVNTAFSFLNQRLNIDWLTSSEWREFLFVNSQNRFRCNHRYSWDTRFATIIYEGPRGTILPHNCCPNAYILVDKLNFIGTVVTNGNVKKGELLTVNLDPDYPRSICPLPHRNIFLTTNGYPLCGPSGIQCSWCLDPQTEGGVMLSAVKCHKCAVGHLMPKKVINNSWIYTCNTEGCCGMSEQSSIDEEERLMSKMYHSFKGDVPKIYKWLGEIGEKSLHPLNYLCVRARFFIAGKCGNMMTKAKVNTLQHLRKAKEEYLSDFEYIVKWMEAFTPGRNYYRAEFRFFEALVTLGGYAVDLHEKKKSLKEVDELVGKTLKVLEWCWDIFHEDPMRNLMDLNEHEKTQSKFISQFFVAAERIHNGKFRPLHCGGGVEVLGKKPLVPIPTASENINSGSGDQKETEFKNLRYLVIKKKNRVWSGLSHLGDHLAPPGDAHTLVPVNYTIECRDRPMDLLD